MKIFISIFIIFFTQNIFADKSILFMFVGEQRMLDEMHGFITLTNPNVVKLNNKRLIAVKSGVSVLKDNKKEVLIYALPSTLKPLGVDLEKILQENKNFSLVYKDKKINLYGEANNFKEWLKLRHLKNTFAKNLDLKINGQPDLLKKVQEAINDELESKAFYGANAEIKNNKVIIYSNESNSKFFNKTKEIAEHWGVFHEGSELLEIKPLIEIEITIAEVKKNMLRQLGVTLPTQYSAKVSPFNLNEVTVGFNALLKNQSAKIIANPKLLCRSGETAKFIAGGEIPIKLSSSRVVNVEWKKYGVILNITPQADSNKRISTKLLTEVSLLDESHVVDGIPGILTNRVETYFDLTEEKTIALSGLIKNELGRGDTGTPILSEIPILGELFKSRDYKQNKTELLILVTPKVMTQKKIIENKLSDFWKSDD